jgi:hypothetical protein
LDDCAVLLTLYRRLEDGTATTLVTYLLEAQPDDFVIQQLPSKTPIGPGPHTATGLDPQPPQKLLIIGLTKGTG